MVTAGVVWTYWLGVVGLIIVVLTELGFLIGYIVRVKRLELEVERWRKEYQRAISAGAAPGIGPADAR
jgi:hypothetical protein